MIHDAVVYKITRRNPFLQDWPYYGIIDILNPTTTAQYQHSVTIPTKPGMAHDFRDLRFLQADGTEIPFWNESKTDGSTSFNWIKPYSASQRKAYVFYGNREAVSQSNGDKTFEFFDDFLGSALDTTTKWTTAGSGTRTVSSSILQMTSPSNNFNTYSKTTFGTNTAIRSKSLFTFSSNNYRYSWIGYANAEGQTPYAIFTVTDGEQAFHTYTNNGSLESNLITDGDSNYHTYEICRNTSANVKFYIDGTLKFTHTSQIPTGSLNVDIGVYPQQTAPNVQSDWILVRKYTATEPVCQLNQSGLRNPIYR